MRPLFSTFAFGWFKIVIYVFSTWLKLALNLGVSCFVSFYVASGAFLVACSSSGCKRRLLQSYSRFSKELTEEASTTLAGNLFHELIIFLSEKKTSHFILYLFTSFTFNFHLWPLNAWPPPLSNQEAQLMLTNPRDTFRGQSRSANIVPFHMLGIVSCCAIVTLSLRPDGFRYSTSENVVTLKSGSEVTQGHGKLYHSIQHPWLPINVP